MLCTHGGTVSSYSGPPSPGSHFPEFQSPVVNQTGNPEIHQTAGQAGEPEFLGSSGASHKFKLLL